MGFGNDPGVRSWMPGMLNGAPATKADNFRMSFWLSYKYRVVGTVVVLVLSLYTLLFYRAIHTFHRLIPSSIHLLSTR